MKPFTAPFTTFTDHFRGQGRKSLLIEWGITLTCGIGNMLFGYDQGVMGGFLTSAPFERTFPSISNGNATLQGFTVAVYEIGCAAGSLSVIFGGDRFGRRMTVMLGQAILIVGAILQFTSYSLAQLIVGRIVTGIGNGMAVTCLPTWNSECCRASGRGKAICWQLNINIFGIALAYWMDYGLTTSATTGNTDWAWRFPLSVQVILALLAIFLCFWLPDSPRVLIKRGRPEEARDVIDMLSATADPAQRAIEVETEMTLISGALSAEEESNTGWSTLFTQGKERYFQRLCLGVVGLSLLQWSGINLITYYAPELFQNTIGMSRNTASLMSGFNGLEYWLATLLPIPLIDRVGRRPLLLFSAIGQTICMAVLAGTIAFPNSSKAGYAATVFLFVFNTVFSIGFVNIPWLIPVECSPLATRGKTIAVSNAAFWMSNFFVVMISPVLINNIKWGTYLFWGIMNLSMIPVIYFFIPETAGVEMEHVDKLFEQEQKWLIGPGSKRKLAKIVDDYKAAAVMRARIDAQEPGADMMGMEKGHEERVA